jgi:hypothetical protein
LKVLDIGKCKFRDVVKAAASILSSELSYMKAWRALSTTKDKMRIDPKLAYKLLVPYMEKFKVINPNCWRSTERLDDSHYLPSHYGTVTSNASESSNKMYKGANYGTWLNTLDIIWILTGDRFIKKYQFAKLRNHVCPNIEKKIKITFVIKTRVFL